MMQASTNQFLEERRRTRRFFNRMSPLYPIVERHLFPEYRRAALRVDREERVSEFGGYWLCTPLTWDAAEYRAMSPRYGKLTANLQP